jgi:DUF1016 N-terminal domain
MKGLSVRNLEYMRQFAASWPDSQIAPQSVAQLPWGHYADLWVMPISLSDLALGAEMAA